MPLLDHFHPPLHGPRRWEGFHHSWATFIAQQLNQGVLPANYFAEAEISLGPELEIDVASFELDEGEVVPSRETGTALWCPPRPKLSAKVDFSHLDSCSVHIYEDVGGAELRAAVELVIPANKDCAASRRTFAAKCAGYLKHAIGLSIIDIVTARRANLHEEIFRTLEVKGAAAAWKSATGLYAVSYRAVTSRKSPRVQAWPEPLALGKPLPTMPLWITPEMCLPVRFEDSYMVTCESLRISA